MKKTILKRNGICTFCGGRLDNKGICHNQQKGCWYAGKPQSVEVSDEAEEA